MFSVIRGCDNSKQRVCSHYSKKQRKITFFFSLLKMMTSLLLDFFFIFFFTSDSGNKTFLCLWKNQNSFQCMCEVGDGRRAWVGRERRYSWGKWWKKSKLLASHESTGKGPSMIFVETLRYSLFHRPVDPDCSFHALRKAQNHPAPAQSST